MFSRCSVRVVSHVDFFFYSTCQFSFFIIIYCFYFFGCVGSSFLCEGFL